MGQGAAHVAHDAELPVPSPGPNTSGTTGGANTQSSSSRRAEAILCPARGKEKTPAVLKIQRSIKNIPSLHKGESHGETPAHVCGDGMMHAASGHRGRGQHQHGHGVTWTSDGEEKEMCPV